MTAYYIRDEDETVQGPYEAADLVGWIEEGRLDEQTQYSTDAITWRYARDLPELGGSDQPAPLPEGAFPEPSLWIRQGTNIQGPYRFSRIRRYVRQRRIQHYMLFSPDGTWWLGPESVPGLLPEGYVPLPPPDRPTAVEDAQQAVMPSYTAPPAPGEDIGSSTLVGFRLDQEETMGGEAPAPVAPALPPLPEEEVVAAPGPLQWYVRTNGHDVFGPCDEPTLRGWIEEGRVTAQAELSNDGVTWQPGTGFRAFFAAAPARRIPGGGSAPAPTTSSAPSPTRRRRR